MDSVAFDDKVILTVAPAVKFVAVKTATRVLAAFCSSSLVNDALPEDSV